MKRDPHWTVFKILLSFLTVCFVLSRCMPVETAVSDGQYAKTAGVK